ncbi:MAG TPA: universal stress protein [Myxococcales bacterium]|nr:universal stress protein [Myxococcales bacterium]
MALWKSIACAVDESDGSDRAIGAAARLAHELDAELVLIHVDPPIEGEGGEAVFAPPPARRILDLHRDRIERWSAAASDMRGEPVRVQLASGDAASEIVAFARTSHCDLLVIGSRARSPLSLALGSVAAKVLVHAPCPVLVVSPRVEDVMTDFPGQAA